MIIAVVGAGGKTSTIKNLAKKYCEEGKRVLVTTTTHMMIEEETVLTEDAEQIEKVLKEKGHAMVGVRDEDAPLKIKSLPESVYVQACQYADIILVEADGSKHMPLKYPNSSEPVIPDNADEIMVVCGLHGLGKKAKDVCHRLELITEKLGIAEETEITPAHIQQLITEGYLNPLREKYGEKKIYVSPAHDGSLYHRVVASLLRNEQDVSFLKEEWFYPQPKLIICGGGHVGREVAEFASKLDFYVKVIDDRKELVTKDRFPTADEVICDSFDRLNEYLEPNSFVVVATPDHKADYKCVRTILPTDYTYLGMIGSKGKVAKTKHMLKEEGFTEQQIASIHAPIGLAIGAVTPAEIAISILAEIIQVKNQHSATYADTALLTCKEQGILCLITEKKGSAPRGVGSMMLVCDDKIIGSVGGGLAEYMAIEKAKKTQKIEVQRYELEKTLPNGIDMICGGNIQVIFIPI